MVERERGKMRKKGICFVGAIVMLLFCSCGIGKSKEQSDTVKQKVTGVIAQTYAIVHFGILDGKRFNY